MTEIEKDRTEREDNSRPYDNTEPLSSGPSCTLSRPHTTRQPLRGGTKTDVPQTANAEGVRNYRQPRELQTRNAREKIWPKTVRAERGEVRRTSLSIRIAQLGRQFEIFQRHPFIHLCAPAVAKAFPEFEDGEF